MDGLYRDGTDGARRQLRELWTERIEQVAELPHGYRRVYARRFARAAAGGVMAAFGIILLGRGVLAGIDRGLFAGSTDGELTALLLQAWGAALVAYLFARAWARRRFDDAMTDTLMPSGDLYADLHRARLEAPAVVAHALARKPERWSLALPLVGLSLVLPLTLHMLFFALVGEAGVDAAEFDSWIVASALLVGHCHVVLALCAWRYARRVTAGEVNGASEAWAAWLWTVASSVIPGLVFFGLPVFLVAVTGVFIPMVFPVLAARTRGERLAVA